MENKSQKFKRLGESRVNRIVKQLELLGNLANKSNYDYTSQQVKDIFKVINKELSFTRSRFEKANKNKYKIEL